MVDLAIVEFLKSFKTQKCILNVFANACGFS